MRGQRVASHVKSNLLYGHSTNTEHMPQGQREMMEWDASRFNKWAKSVGPHTERLIIQLLKSKPHVQQAYRACIGVLRFTKSHGNERVEAACLRALELHSISYRTVSSILKNGLEKVSVKPKPTVRTIDHPNVRGPDYYH